MSFCVIDFVESGSENFFVFFSFLLLLLLLILLFYDHSVYFNPCN